VVVVGSGLEEVSLGLVSDGAVSVVLFPRVGLGGMVGFMPVVATSVGAVGLCFGLQLARAAPAAAVAVSFRNVRREMVGRRFKFDLRVEYDFWKYQ